MNINSYRLSILSAAEIDDLYGLPRFTEEDRHLYFDLSVAEREALTAVHTMSAAVHLTLQLGYFKAKRQFFVYEQGAVLEDLRYIMKLHFPERDSASIKTPSRPTLSARRSFVRVRAEYSVRRRSCRDDHKSMPA